MMTLENNLNKLWKNPMTRYLFVTLGGAIADFLISFYYYAISHGWLFPVIGIGFTLPFINLIFSVWFIETKDLKERIKLTFFSALGMVIGNSLMLLTIGHN